LSLPSRWTSNLCRLNHSTIFFRNEMENDRYFICFCQKKNHSTISFFQNLNAVFTIYISKKLYQLRQQKEIFMLSTKCFASIKRTHFFLKKLKLTLWVINRYQDNHDVSFYLNTMIYLDQFFLKKNTDF
jgi:hypothetical protein